MCCCDGHSCSKAQEFVQLRSDEKLLDLVRQFKKYRPLTGKRIIETVKQVVEYKASPGTVTKGRGKGKSPPVIDLANVEEAKVREVLAESNSLNDTELLNEDLREMLLQFPEHPDRQQWAAELALLCDPNSILTLPQRAHKKSSLKAALGATAEPVHTYSWSDGERTLHNPKLFLIRDCFTLRCDQKFHSLVLEDMYPEGGSIFF